MKMRYRQYWFSHILHERKKSYDFVSEFHMTDISFHIKDVNGFFILTIKLFSGIQRTAVCMFQFQYNDLFQKLKVNATVKSQAR
jgi:hypothetical protein